jgi:sugar O-acyltransferase (sialic acid O-acetyltransferase NeuD family)
LNNKKLIIYGNGHMAKMLYQFVKLNFDVAAFTVDQSCISDTTICDLPLIPFEEIEQYFSSDTHCMLIAVGYVEMNGVRERKYQEAKLKGYSFINYFHPSVVMHDCLEVGENNIILDHASIHPYTKLGNGNFISSNTNIGHGCIIGNNNWINAGVGIGGETTLGNRVFLGINVSVGHGLVINDTTFVGANTQINRTTDEGDVYLSESGEKHRMKSQSFLKFSTSM